MSRRRAAPKRAVLPDPKFNSEKLAKFVSRVMVDGKKSIAEKIVYVALGEAIKKIDFKNEVGKSIKEKAGATGAHLEIVLFNMVLDNISPAVEVRSRRVGGSTYQVPTEVRPIRRQALGMRWLVASARQRNEKTMASRLAGEMVDAVNERGIAFKKKEDTHRMAKANQAFAHFRW
jgi:small subunit ribosomal protein S7